MSEARPRPACWSGSASTRQAADAHAAARGLLEEVEAAQEGRLAGAGAADEHDGLVLPYRQADAAQDMVGAEVLLDVGGLEDHVAKRHHQRSPRAMRCSSLSWKYEKMMVRIQ